MPCLSGNMPNIGTLINIVTCSSAAYSNKKIGDYSQQFLGNRIRFLRLAVVAYSKVDDSSAEVSQLGILSYGLMLVIV